MTRFRGFSRLTKRWQTVIVILHAEFSFFDQEADAEQILNSLTKVLRVKSILEQVWSTRRGYAVLPKNGTAFF
jgi:hypothetical protein